MQFGSRIDRQQIKAVNICKDWLKLQDVRYKLQVRFVPQCLLHISATPKTVVLY